MRDPLLLDQRADSSSFARASGVTRPVSPSVVRCSHSRNPTRSLAEKSVAARYCCMAVEIRRRPCRLVEGNRRTGSMLASSAGASGQP
jgi:hypothetical protein